MTRGEQQAVSKSWQIWEASKTRCYPFGDVIGIAELYSLFSKESCSIPLLIRHSFVFWGNQIFRQSLPYTVYSMLFHSGKIGVGRDVKTNTTGCIDDPQM
jgi:hypothetical protein